METCIKYTQGYDTESKGKIKEEGYDKEITDEFSR